MKIKITTQEVVDTTRYITEGLEDPSQIIESICSTHRLTNEFIREFSQFITPEVFMTSYRLSKDVAEAHPELYDAEKFKELLKYHEEEVEISEEEIQQKTATNLINAMRPGTDIASVLMALGMAEEDAKKTKTIITNNLPNISISMLAEFFNEFKDNDDYRLDEKLVEDVIRDSTEEELTNADVLNLMGISKEIDELLLRRIKDESTKNALLLAISVSDEHAMTSSTYKHLTNDFKEDLLGTENVTVKDFVNALSESKDLGWKKKMIQRAVDGEIQLEVTREVMDKELVLLLSALPEDVIVEFTELNGKIPNAFSYKLMSWLLENKSFDEDQLIRMKDIFKKAGLFFNLRKLAQANGYENLKNALMK